MWTQDNESMLMTQIAILESQLQVRDGKISNLESELGLSNATISKLREDLENKDVLIKQLQQSNAYESCIPPNKKKVVDYIEDAGSIG